MSATKRDAAKARARSAADLESLEGFLEALAGTSPTPAGGAAGALAGALAAALLGMVCRVTARRDRSASDLPRLAVTADELRTTLSRLIPEDTDAYQGLLDARRGSTATPAAVQSALVQATEVPLELARLSRSLLGLCERVLPQARASVLSDLSVAAALARAALEAAAITVRVNLVGVTDMRFVDAAAAELDRLLAEAQAAHHRVGEMIFKRVGRPD